MGSILELFGFLALYAYLASSPVERWAFPGLILSILGRVLFLPLTGYLALALPVTGRLLLEGQQGVLEVAVSPLAGAFSLLLLLIILSILGALLFGVAIWKSNTLPKWSAVPFALYTPFFAITASFVVESLGGWLLVIAGGWIALHVMRERFGRLAK